MSISCLRNQSTQYLKSLIIRPPTVADQFKVVGKVTFPKFSGLQCNMMPFIMGEKQSVPLKYQHYWSLVESCNIHESELGKVGFLTIAESFVRAGSTQRRGGVHTEKHPSASWGGGWGGKQGLYLASTIDRTCRIWNCYIETPGPMGDIEFLREHLGRPIELEANQLIQITDSCPHEAIPQQVDGERQFFRVVTSEVDLWYKDHSTPNPLVELPQRVRVIEGNKFK